MWSKIFFFLLVLLKSRFMLFTYPNVSTVSSDLGSAVGHFAAGQCDTGIQSQEWLRAVPGGIRVDVRKHFHTEGVLRPGAASLRRRWMPQAQHSSSPWTMPLSVWAAWKGSGWMGWRISVGCSGPQACP